MTMSTPIRKPSFTLLNGIPSLEDANQIALWVWELVVCLTGVIFTEEINNALPIPENPSLLILIYLRTLENYLRKSGVDERVQILLHLLTHLGRSPSQSTSPPSKELMLAVTREVAVVHMRSDDWVRFDDVYKRQWAVDVRDTKDTQDTEEESIDLRQTKKDITDVHEDFSGLRLEVSQKYPVSKVFGMLLEYIAKTRQELGSLYLEGVCSAIKEGHYAPKEPLAAAARWDNSDQAGAGPSDLQCAGKGPDVAVKELSDEAKRGQASAGPSLAPCSNGSKIKRHKKERATPGGLNENGKDQTGCTNGSVHLATLEKLYPKETEQARSGRTGDDFARMTADKEPLTQCERGAAKGNVSRGSHPVSPEAEPSQLTGAQGKRAGRDVQAKAGDDEVLPFAIEILDDDENPEDEDAAQGGTAGKEPAANSETPGCATLKQVNRTILPTSALGQDKHTLEDLERADLGKAQADDIDDYINASRRPRTKDGRRRQNGDGTKLDPKSREGFDASCLLLGSKRGPTGLEPSIIVREKLIKDSQRLKRTGTDPLPETLEVAQQAGKGAGASSSRQAQSELPNPAVVGDEGTGGAPFNVAESAEQAGNRWGSDADAEPNRDTERETAADGILHAEADQQGGEGPEALRTGTGPRGSPPGQGEAARPEVQGKQGGSEADQLLVAFAGGDRDGAEEQAEAASGGNEQAEGEAAGRRPSLMDRNATARQVPWSGSGEEADDPFEEESPASKRPHLERVPARLAFPALPGLEKEPEQANGRQTAGNKRPRRTTRVWTVQETNALMEGVKKYGHAWKTILMEYAPLFGSRTDVDLKDKHRNITNENRKRKRGAASS